MTTVLVGNFKADDVETVLIHDPLWWQVKGLRKTLSGYGKKLPTENKINFAGRLRRVYIDIFSNSGCCYVIVKGEHISVR